MRDKIIIYNTNEENKVTENLTLEQGELALVREKDKERLFIKNTAGVVVPIHNNIDGGEIEFIPPIQEGWIDSGLASWSGDTSLKNRVKFNSGHTSLIGSFTPPAVSDMDRLTTMYEMFYYCEGLTSLDLSNFNTSNVTDMSYMFENCSGLTSLDLSSWDTSNVTHMYEMFLDCRSLTSLDVSSFNTSNVIDMSGMFKGCSGLTSLDLSSFNTNNVTAMSWMFIDCRSLTSLDLSSFNTSKVANMFNMFLSCSSLQTIKCTEATKTKILTSANTGLPTDFNGWVIV